MDNKLQILKEKADFIKRADVLISETENIKALYELNDLLNDSVKLFYKNIGCKNQCFLCCQHSNVPSATQVEWDYLFKNILALNEKQKNHIIENTKKLFAKYGAELKEIHFALNDPDDNVKLNALYQILPRFQGSSCIFLQKGSCSVYEGRPAKCRTQGYSLVKFGDAVQFQTCVPEVIKMEELLIQQGNRKVLMPYWNDFENKIQSLHKVEIVFSILPVWTYSHIKDDKFIDEVNLNPDFENILASF